jgi:hypothetical protein
MTQAATAAVKMIIAASPLDALAGGDERQADAQAGEAERKQRRQPYV